MSLFADRLVVVRGGGDLATGVVARLHRAGFRVVVLELARPLAIRRAVSVAQAVFDGRCMVEDLEVRLVDSPAEAVDRSREAVIPVLVSELLPAFPGPLAVLVDARLAKQPLDASRDQAPLVVALGPGFVAGEHCHAVVETKRGHHLGRVLWSGPAAPDTGVPGLVGGESDRRVIRAPVGGPIRWDVEIGDRTAAGRRIGWVGDRAIEAALDGVVRGIIHPSHQGLPGLKIADIDPRAEPAACFEISDKALAVGGGVLEAVLTWINRAGSA